MCFLSNTYLTSGNKDVLSTFFTTKVASWEKHQPKKTCFCVPVILFYCSLHHIPSLYKADITRALLHMLLCILRTDHLKIHMHVCTVHVHVCWAWKWYVVWGNESARFVYVFRVSVPTCVCVCVCVCLCPSESNGPWRQASVHQQTAGISALPEYRWTTGAWQQAPPYGHRTRWVYVWLCVCMCVRNRHTKCFWYIHIYAHRNRERGECVRLRDVCVWPLTSGYVSQLSVCLCVCVSEWGAARLSSISHTPGQHLTLGL